MAMSLQKGTGGGLRGKVGDRSFGDPLGLKKSKPKPPPKTAEELAIEMAQKRALDKEIEISEKKMKAMARGKLGRQSLLSGGTPEATVSASGSGRGGRGGAGSLLSGTSVSGGGSASASYGGGISGAGIRK